LSLPYKVCPICETPNHRNSTICSTCGATLDQTKLLSTEDKSRTSTPQTNYDYTYGETDLLENSAQWKSKNYLLLSILTLFSITCITTSLILSQQPSDLSQVPLTAPNNFTTPTPLPAINQEPLITTQNQTILATVTQGKPTNTPQPSPTITPTEGPCIQEVQPGDDLISILFRCGHRDLEPILSTVLTLNDLADASRIQQGQIIEVPWPTPTTDNNLTPTVTANPGENIPTDNSTLPEDDGASIMGVILVPTQTLQPGVTWHQIQKDENIIMIAVQYGATLRILSELNPEVQFSQCDFGLGTGGPNCVVQLFEGQEIRVPAPTPTPTIQPTASGSETPTPSATPTFNIPTILSPSDRAFFRADDIVTLRWIATGALNSDETYLIQVENQTSGQIYTATTRELSFIIPEDWHSPNERYDYLWSLSIININNPDKLLFTTGTRVFTWQGRGE
jgi:hypothetical protein